MPKTTKRETVLPRTDASVCYRCGQKITDPEMMIDDNGPRHLNACPLETKTPKYDAARADRAQKALDAYRDALGEGGPHDPERIRDLAQDFIHWLAMRAVNPDREPGDLLTELFQRAVNDFPMELEGLCEEDGHCGDCGQVPEYCECRKGLQRK